jgi:hypothetical protein
MNRLVHGKGRRHARPKLIPELATLGVYAQSAKPKGDWLTQRKWPLPPRPITTN